MKSDSWAISIQTGLAMQLTGKGPLGVVSARNQELSHGSATNKGQLLWAPLRHNIWQHVKLFGFVNCSLVYLVRRWSLQSYIVIIRVASNSRRIQCSTTGQNTSRLGTTSSETVFRKELWSSSTFPQIDILTKDLMKEKFVFLRDKLGVVQNTFLAKRECWKFSLGRYFHIGLVSSMSKSPKGTLWKSLYFMTKRRLKSCQWKIKSQSSISSVQDEILTINHFGYRVLIIESYKGHI